MGAIYLFPELRLDFGELLFHHAGARPLNARRVLARLILNILEALHVDVFHRVGKAVA